MSDKFEDKRIHEALELLNEVAREKKAELSEMVAGKYANVKSLIEELSQKMQQGASKALHSGKEKAVEWSAEVDESVHKNPWPYIGGTAVVALFVGYLLGRSHK